jgi:acyl carrier protein
MADRTSIEHRLTSLFEKHLNVSVPSVETDLLETGALDSLSFVDLLLRLEEEFGTRTSVEDLEVENFRSIAQIAEFVASRNGSHHGAER